MPIRLPYGSFIKKRGPQGSHESQKTTAVEKVQPSKEKSKFAPSSQKELLKDSIQIKKPDILIQKKKDPKAMNEMKEIQNNKETFSYSSLLNPASKK